MPKHRPPGHGDKGFHDRTHLSSGKTLTNEKKEHRERMALQERQEEIVKALPHALKVLSRQRKTIRESMAKLKVKHGSQKVVIAKINILEEKKKLLLSNGLKTQRQLDSHSAIKRGLKELNQVRKQMADGEKKIREMSTTLAKHNSGR